MEVIEIRCGNCNQTMGVSPVHLGSQVQCPHCKAVVQTPPRDEPPLRGEVESIFTDPEADDVFDSTPKPRIEIPSPGEAFVPEAPPAAFVPVPDLNLDSSEPEFNTALPPLGERPAATKAAGVPPLTPHLSSMPQLAPSLPRGSRRSSLLMPTLLIFLVPYSLVATVFIVFLLTRPRPPHPLESLPDPEPSQKGKKGAPRKVTRVAHDEPLPPGLLTSLGRALRVGDIEVTPLDVRLTPAGNLSLRLKARNLSNVYAFVPVSKGFLDFDDQGDSARPYSFLHAASGSVRVYGGFLEYQTARGEVDLASDGELAPGQQGILQVTTLDKFRDLGVRKLLESRTLIWRVQVRRGVVDVHGEEVSATAVVGVEFAAADVVREKSRPPEDDF